MRTGFLKRFTATLLAVMMLIGMMPTITYADDTGIVEFDLGLTSTLLSRSVGLVHLVTLFIIVLL